MPVRAELHTLDCESVALGGFLACGEGSDEFAHEVGQAEGGEEEDEEGLFGEAGGSAGRGAVGEDGAAFELSKGGGGESGCVSGRWAACDFGKECSEPAQDGEYPENRS